LARIGEAAQLLVRIKGMKLAVGTAPIQRPYGHAAVSACMNRVNRRIKTPRLRSPWKYSGSVEGSSTDPLRLVKGLELAAGLEQVQDESVATCVPVTPVRLLETQGAVLLVQRTVRILDACALQAVALHHLFGGDGTSTRAARRYHESAPQALCVGQS
jgi:hypothetical protein